MSDDDFKGFVRAATGIEGLDDILGGGFPANRMYLLEGDPGAGKTTLALQFLLEGAAPGRARPLRHPLRDRGGAARRGALPRLVARRHHDLRAATAEESLKADAQYTLFHPSEVELGETTRRCSTRSSGCEPMRVVFDSLSEMRLLARDSAALPPPDPRAQAVLHRPQLHRAAARRHRSDDRRPPAPEPGPRRDRAGAARPGLRRRSGGGCGCRRCAASRFRGGYHDYRIDDRRPAASSRGWSRPSTARASQPELVASGVAGARRPARRRPRPRHQHAAHGTGRRRQVDARDAVRLAAAAGAASAPPSPFDECRTPCSRAPTRLGIGAAGHVEAGRVAIRQVDPAELSPGEFVHDVRRARRGRARGSW